MGVPTPSSQRAQTSRSTKITLTLRPSRCKPTPSRSTRCQWKALRSNLIPQAAGHLQHPTKRTWETQPPSLPSTKIQWQHPGARSRDPSFPPQTARHRKRSQAVTRALTREPGLCRLLHRSHAGRSRAAATSQRQRPTLKLRLSRRKPLTLAPR